MEMFNLQVVSIVLIGLGLALVGIWSARYGRARLLMLGLFCSLLGVVFSASASLMGRAKPVELTWLEPHSPQAQIISGHLMENRGIFLTLSWGDAEPRLYVLPWDQKTAQQLLDAMAEAEQNGTQAMVKMPLQKISKNDDEAPFYAEPQRPPAQKQTPTAGIKLS